MCTRPSALRNVIVSFAPVFSKRVWRQAQVLLIGAILTPGKRTVTAALRAMGLQEERHFYNYHRVLNRAVWSSLATSRVLVGLLLTAFAPTGGLVMGLDDHSERRRGERSTAKGIYRDPVRSSQTHFVKASGRRWLSLRLLVPISWAGRVWAVPFLTALCPSERSHQQRGRQHVTLTDRARQMLRVVKRWLPQRALVVGADSSYAALAFLHAVREAVTSVTRLRLAAALYAPAPARRPGQMGRPRKQGKRVPTLPHILENPQTRWDRTQVEPWYGNGPHTVERTTGTAVWYHTGLPAVPSRGVLVRDPQGTFDAQAFLCTNLDAGATQSLQWFVQRWQVEVTFEAARAHLGIETQRQWSDKAIARTTPALFGLYSVVTLLAAPITEDNHLPARVAAWYTKPQATFSDTIAVVRRQRWSTMYFSMSEAHGEILKVPRAVWERVIDTRCYAA